MHGTARPNTRGDRRALSQRTPHPAALVAVAATALGLLLGGCTTDATAPAPVFATEPEGTSDAAVTAACWRVANALTLATNAQRGAESGRWADGEVEGAYRAAARILDYIPVPSGSPVALPLIALQDLVEAPPARTDPRDAWEARSAANVARYEYFRSPAPTGSGNAGPSSTPGSNFGMGAMDDSVIYTRGSRPDVNGGTD